MTHDPNIAAQRGAFDGLAAAERYLSHLVSRMETCRSLGGSIDIDPAFGRTFHAEAERHCTSMAINGASAAEVRAYREAHLSAFEQRLAIFTADVDALTAITEAGIVRLNGARS